MMETALAVLALTLAAIPASAAVPSGDEPAKALIVDGKSLALPFAYVVDVDDVEQAGLAMAGPPKYYVIVLSDRELPPASVNGRFAPFADRRSPVQAFEPLTKSPVENMYGVMLHIEPGKQQPFEAHFLCPGHTDTISISGADYPDRVMGLKREGDHIAGTAILETPHETHFTEGPKQYKYHVAFHATVHSEPTVTAKYEGKDALESAPVKAIGAYLVAAQKGDVAGLRRLTADTHLPYLANPEVIKYLKDASPSTLTEQVKRVVVRGDLAHVMIVNEKPTYSQVMMQLVRDKGEWKLYWP